MTQKETGNRRPLCAAGVAGGLVDAGVAVRDGHFDRRFRRFAQMERMQNAPKLQTPEEAPANPGRALASAGQREDQGATDDWSLATDHSHNPSGLLWNFGMTSKRSPVSPCQCSRRAWTLIVGFVALAVCGSCRGQIVYSTGVYSMGRTQEHDWMIGAGSVRFGLSQYRQCESSNGVAVRALSDTMNATVTWKRCTDVHLGWLHFTVRSPAWVVVTMFAICITVFGVIASWLSSAVSPRVRNRGGPQRGC